MSGQPVKTKADQARYLDEYMENLSLEISLQNQNEEANRIYKQTGQLPAVSSLPDTRTVEQKLSDVESLKRGIIEDVSKSVDKSLAVILVNTLIESRYNSDNVLLRFFGQRAPEFMKEIEKRYKYGLRDINDIYATVKFIERAYSETQESLTSIKDLFGRNQTTTQLNSDTLDNLKITLKDLMSKIALSDLQNYGIDVNKLKQVIQIVSNASVAFPNSKTIKGWNEVISYALGQMSTGGSEFWRADLMNVIERIKILNSAIQDLPELNLVKVVDTNITKALKIVGNPQEQLNIIRDSINNLIKSFFKGKYSIDDINHILAILQQEKNDIPNIIQDIKDQIDYSNNPNVPGAIGRFEQTQMDLGSRPTTGLPIGTLPTNRYTDADKDIIISIAYNFLYNQYDGQNLIPPIPPPNQFQNLTLPQQRQIFNDSLDQLEQQVVDFTRERFQNMDPELYQIIQGAGFSFKDAGFKRMKGGSIRALKVPKTFISRIDTTAGIKASPDFVPFGSYLINRRKIGDGIISLKTGKGSHIQGYPNKRVSNKLSTIVRSIIGGGVPTYEDLSQLDPEEKNYLHQIAKKSNILDKLSIPSPNKDETEKEIHQFEVMKGEIISGNDNKDLIKKFKLLLLKLKMKGMIPKSQAEEILTDLSSLGY